MPLQRKCAVYRPNWYYFVSKTRGGFRGQYSGWWLMRLSDPEILTSLARIMPARSLLRAPDMSKFPLGARTNPAQLLLLPLSLTAPTDVLSLKEKTNIPYAMGSWLMPPLI